MKKCWSCERISRREMLKTSASLATFLALSRRGEVLARSEDVFMRNTARAVIFVYQNGAPSHLDTFDVKDAPWNPRDADIRQYPGGIALSRTLFPKFSQMTGDMLFLRSVRSWEAAHERGVFYMQTAHPSNPAFVAETPHMGAVVAAEKGTGGPMPPFLSLNQSGLTIQGSKFLGGGVAPLSAPANAGGLTTIEHNFFGTQSQARFEQRYQLLGELDADVRRNPPDQALADHADFYVAAKRMMYDNAIASVFRFSEDDNQRYGNSNFGRAAIVARNAIQAKNGALFVALSHSNWDTHQNMFDRGYAGNMYQLCGELDSGVGTLVQDLKASGDLDSTLIVIMGEFGRTPGPLNSSGGRDHHRDAMSVVMIGGGVKGGRVIGATDSNGEKIVDAGWSGDRAIVMEDIGATVYSALGINWTKSIEDTPSGRKFEYVPFGATGRYTSIDEVFG
jgi:uncharacterized protein (DUF1501 family)